MSSEEKRKESFPPGDKEKYHRLYDIGRDSLLEQSNRIESLDKKAQINLVVIGIIVSLGLYKPELISDLVSKVDVRNLININNFQVLFVAISFFFFIISLVFSILALLPRSFQTWPDVTQLSETFESKKVEDLDASMNKFLQDIINANDKLLESKTKDVRKGIIYILIAFPFGVVFIILTVIAKILDA